MLCPFFFVRAGAVDVSKGQRASEAEREKARGLTTETARNAEKEAVWRVRSTLGRSVLSRLRGGDNRLPSEQKVFFFAGSLRCDRVCCAEREQALPAELARVREGYSHPSKRDDFAKST